MSETKPYEGFALHLDGRIELMTPQEGRQFTIEELQLAIGGGKRHAFIQVYSLARWSGKPHKLKIVVDDDAGLRGDPRNYEAERVLAQELGIDQKKVTPLFGIILFIPNRSFNS